MSHRLGSLPQLLWLLMLLLACDCGHRATSERELTMHQNKCRTHSTNLLENAPETTGRPPSPPGQGIAPTGGASSSEDIDQHTGGHDERTDIEIDPLVSDRIDFDVAGSHHLLQEPASPTPAHGATDSVPDLRPRRMNRRLPQRYRDVLPVSMAQAPAPEPMSLPTRVILRMWEHVRMAPNAFGLFREFLGRPSYVPDSASQVKCSQYKLVIPDKDRPEISQARSDPEAPREGGSLPQSSNRALAVKEILPRDLVHIHLLTWLRSPFFHLGIQRSI
ncbi:hypothetical protein JB92DRAFT_2833641 [Gautieria morchelliformis]|nr:hypothetical protein JB92DRAFT_2833641 [Gautieria morchelliformis]